MDNLPEIIAEKIKLNDSSGCWEWTASIRNTGYGSIKWERKTTDAHRLVYRLLIGDVPSGLVLDHLCRVRSCVNPSHLEPVTPGENVRRGFEATKTHCKSGHPLTGDNLRILQRNGTDRRICIKCGRDAAKRYYWRRKGV